LFWNTAEHVLSFQNSITLVPIGRVHGGRKEPIDDHWDSVQSAIMLDPGQFQADALAGLDAFSHIEVVFYFDRVPDEEIRSGARRPRGRSDWPEVGIFAQRGKGRPNRIGVGICRLERIAGLALHVRGLDAIDGTPVLDIKPVMRGFLPRGEIREPAWATEIMKNYW
jgi:tRNA (adenine37-N6)-methyltransferase